MKMITRSQAIKEMRAIAKKAGLTFKGQNAYINGKKAYKFIDRVTGVTKLANCTFWTCYENCVSGYIESYDPTKGFFNGIGAY